MINDIADIVEEIGLSQLSDL